MRRLRTLSVKPRFYFLYRRERSVVCEQAESGRGRQAYGQKRRELDAASLSKVQLNMQNEVLESSKYPEISFRSTHVQSEGATAWRVNGSLTLHGVTRPVIVAVRLEQGAYVGTASIKQTEFGIRPIKAGGGVVKVKNELEIRFKIYTTSRR